MGNSCAYCGNQIESGHVSTFCIACDVKWKGIEDLYSDEDDNDDGWTEEEEEDLIADGICPECGADLDLCGHGINLYDYDQDDDYVEVNDHDF